MVWPVTAAGMAAAKASATAVLGATTLNCTIAAVSQQHEELAPTAPHAAAGVSLKLRGITLLAEGASPRASDAHSANTMKDRSCADAPHSSSSALTSSQVLGGAGAGAAGLVVGVATGAGGVVVAAGVAVAAGVTVAPGVGAGLAVTAGAVGAGVAVAPGVGAGMAVTAGVVGAGLAVTAGAVGAGLAVAAGAVGAGGTAGVATGTVA